MHTSNYDPMAVNTGVSSSVQIFFMVFSVIMGFGVGQMASLVRAGNGWGW